MKARGFLATPALVRCSTTQTISARRWAPRTFSTLEEAAEAISKVFVQYAGQLALGKVLQSSTPEALDGVLTLAEDKQTLTVDFSDPVWQRVAAGGSITNIVGRKEATDVVFREAEWSDKASRPTTSAAA